MKLKMKTARLFIKLLQEMSDLMDERAALRNAIPQKEVLHQMSLHKGFYLYTPEIGEVDKKIKKIRNRCRSLVIDAGYTVVHDTGLTVRADDAFITELNKRFDEMVEQEQKMLGYK